MPVNTTAQGNIGMLSIAQEKQGSSSTTAFSNISLEGLSKDGVTDYQFFNGDITTNEDPSVAGSSPDQTAPHSISEFSGYTQNVNMSVGVITNVRQSSSGLGAYVENSVTETDGDADANAIIDFGYHYYSPFFTYGRGAIKAADNYSNRQWWNQFGTSNTLNYGTSSASWTSTGSAEDGPNGNALSNSNIPDYFKVKWSVSTSGSSTSGGGRSVIVTATDYSGGRSSAFGTAATYVNGLTNDTWIAHPTTAGNSTSFPQYGISFRASAGVLNFDSSGVTATARGVWTVEVWWRKSGFFDTKIMEHTFETKAIATAFLSGGFPP